VAVAVVDSEEAASAQALFARLGALRADVCAEASAAYHRWRPRVTRRAYLPSAFNLAAYVALRRHDLRELQPALMPLGLSALDRCEPRVVPELDAVLAALGALAGQLCSPAPTPRLYFRGARLLAAQSAAVFGPAPAERDVRILATLPTQAADDYGEVIRRMIVAGADALRIDCARDDHGAWTAMIAHVRAASRTMGRPCRIYADLAGPKLRVAQVRTKHDAARVAVGDRIALTRKAARADLEGVTAVISCAEPSVLARVRPGDPCWIDEGKIGTVVERAIPDRAVLLVTHAPPRGAKLKSDRRISVPNTDLGIPALTEKDHTDLAFLARRVDVIGSSFVRDTADLDALLDALDAHGAPTGAAVALTLETAGALAALPELLVRAAGCRPTAVSFVRGDLAVALGRRKLAALQEELLWICEAAHVPVIRTTDALDALVREGVGMRAELPDGALAERADAVLLGEGEHAVDAIEALTDVLARIEGHQARSVARSRAPRVW
jgi:pyruvate kinase